ncbi:unnamed protein product, partial [Rotaria sp. Silwood2]
LSQEVFEVQDNAAEPTANHIINSRIVYDDNYLNVTFGQTKPWLTGFFFNNDLSVGTNSLF